MSSEKLYRRIDNDGSAHLAPSRDTEGALRGLKYDSSNRLVGHAEWEEVNLDDYGYPFEDYDDSNEVELTPEQKEAVVVIGEAIAAGIILVFREVVAPQVKSWWKASAVPVIKRKIQKISDKKRARKHSKEKGRKLTASTEPSIKMVISEASIREIDEANNKYKKDMSSEEAQRELLKVFLNYAEIAVSLRKLSNARVVMSTGMSEWHLEGQRIADKLGAPDVLNSINAMLKSNPSLFEEQAALLSEILGRSLSSEEPFLPIGSSDIC